jgi:hypothetical protein
MTFSIRRTSTIGDDVPPCGEVIRHGPPPSTVVWGGEVAWTRTFTTLEELWAFVAQWRAVIWRDTDWMLADTELCDLPMLEIYDAWRE